MKFTIPDEFMGMTAEEAIRSVETRKQKTVVPPAPQQVNVNANITRGDFLQIAGTNCLIGKREILKGKNWYDAHYALSESGLYMPNPQIFMNHFMNVRFASEGRTKLYDGNGNLINQGETNELWQYLSSTDRANRGNCWTWLDALFKKDADGKMYMETFHKAIKDTTGNWQLPGNNITLDNYLEVSGGWAGLPFNKQGLADKSSSDGSYVQGKNIYFLQPIENRVARFVADSGGAGLICDRYPADANSSLGVFACAEGAVAPKK